MTAELIGSGTGAVVTDTDARESVERARSHVKGFWQEVKWQIEHRAHELLGYPDFDALWATEYEALHVSITREERPEVVAAMRAIGQTQQQIADKVGVSQRTVSSDLNSNFANEDPPITNSRGQQRPASYQRRDPEPPAPHNWTSTSEALAKVTETTKTETWVDTETGEVTAPPTAQDRTRTRRNPLPEQARTAGWDLRKAVERLERIAADDRFAGNKEQVAAHLRGHLTNAIEVCQDLLDRINNQLTGAYQ